jgi:hypothetical protein
MMPCPAGKYSSLNRTRSSDGSSLPVSIHTTEVIFIAINVLCYLVLYGMSSWLQM